MMKRKYIVVCWLANLESLKKLLSIPKLELTAVVLSVKMASLIRKELNFGNIAETFWTDSQVVLAYIRSTTKIFKVFVAN